MDSCAISLFSLHLFSAGDQMTSPLRCLCSVSHSLSSSSFQMCRDQRGITLVCQLIGKGDDLIFLNRESTLKRCLLASVRSHQGTELHFGGSLSSNDCKGKSCCLLFNKPQSKLFTEERGRGRFAQRRSVSLLLPWVHVLSYLWKSNGLLQQTSICKAPPRGGSDYQLS